MNPDEYQRMFDLEDKYWWFVARRHLALTLLSKYRPAETVDTSELRILDLGCGTGAVLQELAQKYQTAVGLDFSELALRFAYSRDSFRLVRGDGTQLPFQDNCFDQIVGLDVFEHIEDDKEAFKECLRVLKPGGFLVLSVPAFHFLWSPHDVALHHYRRYRKEDLVSKLKSTGFQISKCCYSNFLIFPLVVLVRLFEKLGRSDPHASLPRLGSFLNKIMIGLQRFESRLLLKFNLPWGSSVISVTQKPQ